MRYQQISANPIKLDWKLCASFFIKNRQVKSEIRSKSADLFDNIQLSRVRIPLQLKSIYGFTLEFFVLRAWKKRVNTRFSSGASILLHQYGAANGTWTRTSKTHAPQTCLSAYSSTAAIDFNIIALKFIIVNSFFVFSLGFTVCSLLINYCTKLFPVLSLLLLKDQN